MGQGSLGATGVCINGHENASDAIFCVRCGSPLVPSVVKCANGHENARDAAFCAKCGLSLAPSGASANGEPTVAPPITPPSIFEPSPSAPQPPVTPFGSLYGARSSAGKKRSSRLWLVVPLIAVAVIAAGAFAIAPKVMGPNATTPTPVTHTFRGTVVLWKGASGSWDVCSGTGGYADITAGGNVRITNGAGDVIAGGFLKNITEADLPTIIEMDRSSNAIGLHETDDAAAMTKIHTFLSDLKSIGSCMLWWEIKDVPLAGVYSISITHRGTLDYNTAEIEKKGWVVSSSLGD